MDNWVGIITQGFIGSGLLVFIVNYLIEKKGKVSIIQRYLKVYYVNRNKVGLLEDFLLELTFSNTTKTSVVISDFKIRFYDGKQYFELYFEDFNLSPTIRVEATNKFDLSYKLLPRITNILNPMLWIIEDIAFLEIKYKIKNIQKTEFINSSDIYLEEKPPQYSIY
jgi:hypothetical protein